MAAKSRTAPLTDIEKMRMLKQIAHTDTYTLTVDCLKNRIYCTLLGPYLPEIRHFINDSEKAALFMSTGFTILVDSTQFRWLPLLWLETSARTQKQLQKAGLLATAEIVHQEIFEEISRFNLERVTGLERLRLFIGKEEAETWLDGVNAEGMRYE